MIFEPNCQNQRAMCLSQLEEAISGIKWRRRPEFTVIDSLAGQSRAWIAENWRHVVVATRGLGPYATNIGAFGAVIVRIENFVACAGPALATITSLADVLDDDGIFRQPLKFLPLNSYQDRI